jgi:hypothetical protein
VQRLYYNHDPAAVANLINNAYTNVSAQALPPDRILLSDPADLDPDAKHKAVVSAQRAIAQLDQPHPQVVVGAWSLQLTTQDSKSIGNMIPQLENLVGAYNTTLEDSLQAGWRVLADAIADPNQLDPLMREYLTSSTHVLQPAGGPARVERWERPYRGGSDPERNHAENASEAGKTAGYGLGYTTLYYPLTPNLVDMLVTVVSLRQPREVTARMIDRIEGNKQSHSHEDCRARDFAVYDPNGAAGSAAAKEDQSARSAPPNLQLECVYDALLKGLLEKHDGGAPATSELGQMRAALVDFLFHYKNLVEYPAEFSPYLEPMAADTLDSAFAPIVDAFDDDIEVFQNRLQEGIKETLNDDKRIKYGYGGVVTVRVLGDQEGVVKTATQNYFDATPPVSIADVFSSLSSQSGSASSSPLSSLLSSAPPAQAAQLLGTLAQSLTPKASTAHLGRGLDLSVTAHTLSGAFGAELDLSVQSTENGAGITQEGNAKTTDDLNSRVSQHSVDTHIRVDSLKLFEVSTLGSLLARGRPSWKPFDPVEIPLLSLIVNRPRSPELVYSQSLVFVDAIIVPTAADLGYGVPITDDQLEIEQGRFEKIHELSKFPHKLGERILQYHSQVIDCLNREYLNKDGLVRANLSFLDERRSQDIDGQCYNLVNQDLSTYDGLR